MRKIIFTIIVFVYFFTIAYSQSGWVVQASGSNKYFTNVYFINTNTGFVTGDTLMKTTNGGLNWFIQTTGYSGGIYFENAATGYIGYIDNTSARGIAKTTNAGVNWNLTSTTPTGPNSFSFINASTGWGAAGAQFSGAIYKTTNAGLNWTSIFSADGQLFVQFINENTGYTICYYSGLNKTVNGGYNWANISPGNYCLTLFALDTNLIYTGGVGGHIYKSTNGGLHWDSLYSASSIRLYSVFFLNANTGYIVGESNTILATTNGGASWVSQYYTGTGNLFSVFFINPSTGWAVGENGVILKTTDGGGLVGLQPISENIPERFHLYQNYPNPFNPETKIKFSISSEGGALQTGLFIYDVLGKKIETLVDGKLQSGSYEISWNASVYPSGIYFAKLSSGAYGETMKMILLK